MITDVYFVYDDDIQRKRVEDAVLASPTFHFIDVWTKKGQKEAFSLKGHWAARLNPFAIAMNKDIPVKAFYTEADKDIISSLLTYLQNAAAD